MKVGAKKTSLWASSACWTDRQMTDMAPIHVVLWHS